MFYGIIKSDTKEFVEQGGKIMTEVEGLCRELLTNYLELVEEFCLEAVYATDKEVHESEILEDDNFPKEFGVIRSRYGKPRNFINLLHRELKKLAKEEFLLNSPSLQEIVQMSRLFLKETKVEMEKLKDYAELVGVPALVLAIEEFKHLKKQEKRLGIEQTVLVSEEDEEVLQRIRFYAQISEYLPGNKRG